MRLIDKVTGMQILLTDDQAKLHSALLLLLEN
jgi:hypothetical protein